MQKYMQSLSMPWPPKKEKKNTQNAFNMLPLGIQLRCPAIELQIDEIRWGSYTPEQNNSVATDKRGSHFLVEL